MNVNDINEITEEEFRYIVERFNRERKPMCTQLNGINTYYERIKKDYIASGAYSTVYGLRDVEGNRKYVLRITKNHPYFSNREEEIMEKLKGNQHMIHYVDKFSVTIGSNYFSCLIEPYYYSLPNYFDNEKTQKHDKCIAVIIGKSLLPLLQVLFEKKIFHRDIKIENIFLLTKYNERTSVLTY